MFNWLFGGSRDHEQQEYEIEPDVEYISRIEALKLARDEATRDLHESSDQITYVKFHEPFGDYCRINIEFLEPDRGEYFLQPLPPDERLESELVDDKKIRMVAMNGNLLNAVRMYRNLHSVGLAVAKSAVEKMVDDS